MNKRYPSAITEEEFVQLPREIQFEWLYQRGDFVMDIRYYGFKVNLYQLGSFYVEVFYHHKQDRIERLQLLDQESSRMNFYADQIKIVV